MIRASELGPRRHAAGEALRVEQLEQRGERLRCSRCAAWPRGTAGARSAGRACGSRRCAASRGRSGPGRRGRSCGPRRRSAGRSGGGRRGRRAGGPRGAAACARGRLSQSIDTISRGKCVNGLAATPAGRGAARAASRVSTMRNSRPNLSPHLVPPLQGERGRADDEHGAGPVAEEQLLDDQAGLDGLAQADVVGDQQVDAGHLQRPHHRVELVVLDRDARAERRLERPAVGGGDGAPAHGVEEGVEPAGSSKRSAGTGRVAFSRIAAPGSISQMTSGRRRGRRPRRRPT